MANTDPWYIRLRRDTAQQWAIKNPILLLDEVGLETDTRKFKIGNGITPWALLPYGQVTGEAGLLVFISRDQENRLVYGSDGGLYLPEIKIDCLAKYILARS